MLGVLGFSGALLTSCAGARGGRQELPRSGFLRDYTELKHRDGYDADLIYIDPDTQWSQYDAVHLESVTIWADRSSATLKADERQALTDFFYKALYDKLAAANFRLVDRAGPGVVTFRAALTQARGATVPLKTTTTVVPQVNIISSLVGTGADVVATVGETAVEAELLDSLRHERIAAVVDERAGKKWVTQLRTWSDVKSACDFWAERFVRFLERQGVQRAA
jgi:hypothetical protein